MERLKLVFDGTRYACLKMAPAKCIFFKPKVKYVGHIFSEEVVDTDLDTKEKIKNWPTLKTPEEIRQFIGFAGYYRRSKPLTKLMPTQKKNNKKNSYSKILDLEKQENAFVKLKELLSTAPILGYADYTKPFELHTDASESGLGAVLYQNQEGHDRVKAYASRGPSKSKKNYPAHKL